MTLVNNIKSTDKYILFIYTYLFLMPWNFEKWQMGVLTVILFIWWIYKYRSKIIDKLKNILEFKPLLILIIFIVFTYISVLWSESIYDGFKHVNKFHKYYFFIIPILFTSLNKEEAKVGLKIILCSFATYALFSIFIYLGFFKIDETLSDSLNPKGIMAFAIVSVYMVVGTICSFVIINNTNKKSIKIFFVVVMLLCFVGLLINKGGTAKAAFLFTIITLMIFYGKKYIYNIKYIISTIIIVGLGFYILSSSGKLEKFKKSYTQLNNVIKDNKYEGSFGERLYFHKAGFQIIKDNYIFGMGPVDNTDKLEEIQLSDKNSPPIVYTSFHSQHLDTITRYGLIGYFLLVFSGIYLLYKLKDNKEYYFLGLSFFLVTFYSSLGNVMLIKKPFNYIYITVFVLLSVIAYSRKKELSEN